MMFCSGSKESFTPRPAAVEGMSCINPRAPACETAFGLKLLSCFITAFISPSWTP